LLLSLSLSAQQVQIIDAPPAGTVTPDHAFGALDFTAVNSGFLAEKGIPLARLSKYNGSDSVFVNKHSLDRICATLAGATVNGSAPTVIGIVEPASISDTIPFNLLLFDYHSLDPNAVNNGLLSINNGQLQHVSGAGSPYVANRLFAAAPSVSRELPAGTYIFRIDQHAGASMPILSTKVDFGDGGGLQAVQDGDWVSVQYSSGGSVEITTELTLWNRTKLTSKSRINIAAPAGSASPAGPETYCTNNDFTFTVNTTENGTVHTATVTARSACCDTEIRKPFIVINGFETPALEDFFGFTFNGLINNLQFFAGSPTGNSIYNDLESSDYDILFIDFADETEALEINARLVEEAIREINARKHQAGSSEQNVVVGISMGGVVGKLALLDMEAAGEQHESAVFFSMDSPLRGANIPLGAQFAVDHLANETVFGVGLGDMVELLGTAVEVLERPSPKQMLIYHKDGYIEGSGTIGLTMEHTDFYEMLRNKGALTQCEHIAVSNGSQIGIGQGFNAGAPIFKAEGNANDFVGLAGLDLSDFGGFFGGILNAIIDLGLNQVDIDFDLRTIPEPATGNHRIYKGEVSTDLFFGLLTINYLFREVKIGGPNLLPLDSAPGGFVDIPQPEDFGLPAGIFDNPPAELSLDRFCFIPTISALEIGPFRGFTSTFADLYTDVSDNDAIIGSGQTLVTRYVAVDDDPDPTSDLENNQAHPGFSFDNTGVILTEILNNAGFSSPLLARTYNFGKANIEYDYQAIPAPSFTISQTPTAIDEDKFIGSGGEVWVNKSGTIGYTDVSSNPANELDQFELFIRKGCDPQTLVTISNNARMELGQWDATAGITNTAQVYVQADATVSIQAQGELYINKDSRFIVQEGGYAEVLSDGLLSAGFGGQVRIEKGGEARIGSGGILRVSQDSKCVVEDGGKLVLEPGAIVQLWDGDDPFGRAVLEVQGELEVQGSIDFSGNGFFDFFQSHILSLTGGIFRIEGRGIGKRFLRLRNNTTLDIGDNTVELLEGLAEYGNYAKISVGQGEAFISNMELKTGGQTAVGLLADGATKIRFVYNEAYGFANAVEAYNTYPSNALDFLFFQSGFSDNRNALWLSNGSNARVWDCHFNGTGTGVNAMLLDELQSVRVDASVIENYNVPTEPEYMTWGAVHVSNVGEYIMSGGELSNNDVGLYCPPGKYVNVTLRGQAEVADNDFYGLHIVEGNREGSNYGLVTMDCAKLLNNGLAGVKGKNLILNIDAFINSQTDNLAFARSNHFQRGPNDALWFDICYDGTLAETINAIPAEGNYWGTDHANPEPGGGLYYYALDKANFGGCGGFPEISLGFGTKATGAPTSCPSGPPTGPHVPPSKDCSGLMATPTEQLGGSFFDAFFSYQDRLEQEELTEATYPLFADVAQKSNTERGTASDQCKHYIDVSRVFVPHTGGQNLQSAGGSPQGIQQRQGLSLSGQPSAFPNPAQNEVAVEWNPGTRFSLRAINAAGQEVWSGLLPSGTHRLPVDSWAEGWYFLHFTTADGQRAHQLKVMVQR
jgi:hypothetical protein